MEVLARQLTNQLTNQTQQNPSCKQAARPANRCVVGWSKHAGRRNSTRTADQQTGRAVPVQCGSHTHTHEIGTDRHIMSNTMRGGRIYLFIIIYSSNAMRVSCQQRTCCAASCANASAASATTSRATGPADSSSGSCFLINPVSTAPCAQRVWVCGCVGGGWWVGGVGRRGDAALVHAISRTPLSTAPCVCGGMGGWVGGVGKEEEAPSPFETLTARRRAAEHPPIKRLHFCPVH